MKIKTSDAARTHGIHPAHFLLHVAELESSLTFNDVWPEIDEAWVETVAITGKHRSAPRDGEARPPFPPVPVPPLNGLSYASIHVLDKLSRQGKWGKISVAFDALMNLTHLSKRDLDEAIGQLRKLGFLDHDGSGRGTISLNSAKRREIDGT